MLIAYNLSRSGTIDEPYYSLKLDVRDERTVGFSDYMDSDSTFIPPKEHYKPQLDPDFRDV